MADPTKVFIFSIVLSKVVVSEWLILQRFSRANKKKVTNFTLGLWMNRTQHIPKKNRSNTLIDMDGKTKMIAVL